MLVDVTGDCIGAQMLQASVSHHATLTSLGDNIPGQMQIVCPPRRQPDALLPVGPLRARNHGQLHTQTLRDGRRSGILCALRHLMSCHAFSRPATTLGSVAADSRILEHRMC